MKTLKKIILTVSAVLTLGPLVAHSAESGSESPSTPKSSTARCVLEQEFAKTGPYKVRRFSASSDNKIYKKFTIWYPECAETDNGSYPVIIMVNGTGTPASRYKDVFRHFASWGFIVAGNEDENSRTGASSAATLDCVIRLNKAEGGPLYGKADTANIGIVGHSQGGVGAINAVTNQPNGHSYKAICSLSPTSPFWGQDDELGAEWRYDMAKVGIPCFIVAGTGYFDAGKATDISAKKGQGICPLWGMLYNFKTTPASTDKIMARRKGKDHGDMLRVSNGYVTAWFLYYLKGDVRAGKAFYGDDAELPHNPYWQDVHIHQGSHLP